ncbi:MAG: hypothetical protein F2562_02745, partial [Actinobacteria bacterium]|nr:hypothetical protein [Actinomycetota bacterium]
LTNATSYSFRVSAVNASGSGIASSPVTAVPFGVPGTSGTLSAIASNGQVVLLWSAPTSDGGSSIIGYRIESSINGTTWNDVVVDTGSASTVHVVNGLTNGTTYSFRVSARNTSGLGAVSNASTATPAGTPTAPRVMSATGGSAQVQLSWTAPSSNGGGAITGYRIESSADGGTTWTTVNANTATTSTTFTVTGLTDGQSYAFRVYALNAIGSGSASAVVSAVPMAVAGQPANLTVVPGNGNVVLSWTAPTGAIQPSGYSIERSTDGTNWSTSISNTGSAATSVVVSGLANGTLYYFRVAAVNGSGTGSASASASGTPFAGPTAPRSLVIVAGNGTAALSWSTPLSNGGSAIVGYRVERSVDAGVTWTTVVADTASTATTYNASGLTNGSAVSFRVSALNASGVGASSSVVTAIPFAGPTAPATVNAIAGDGAVVLSWTTAGDNGSPVIGYSIESTTDGTTWTTVTTTGNSLTSYTVSGLTNGTTYTFRVAGANAAGVGSSTASVGVTPSRAPGGPTDVTATPSNGGAILAWNAPVDDGGSVVTGYRVEQSTDNGSTWSTIVSDTASISTSRVVSGLSNGSAYLFRVRSINASGVGAASVPASVVPAGLPGTPTSLGALASDGSVVLTFAAPSNDGGNPIVGYRVEQSTDGSNFIVVVSNSNSVIPAVAVSGLVNGTSYSFRVSAINTIGVGPVSATIQSTPASVPSAPAVTSSVGGSGQVTLAWSAPSNDGGSPVTSYGIERSIDGITWTPVQNDLTVRTSTISGLTNGVAYLFRVNAVNAVGASVFGAPVAGLPAGVPGTPRVPVAVTSDSTVSLNWEAPTSNGGSPILSYTVERLLNGSWSTVATGITTPSYTVSGLSNGTSYQFRVSAVNAVGAGVATNTMTVAPATVPDAATAVTLVPGDSQLSVSWSPPSSNGGLPIALYRVEQSIGGGVWSTATTVAGSSTSAVITGLSNGTPVSVRVVAVNSLGESIPSVPSTSTPVNVPTEPSLVAAVAGDSSVALEWSIPAGDGGAPIIGYRVEMNDGSGWVTITSSTGNPGLLHIVSGLTNGVSHQFRVSALNASGSSVTSNTMSATPFSTASAPTTLTVTSGNGRLDLAWSTPATNGGRTITGYRIFASNDGSTWTTLVSNTNSTNRTYSYTGLVNGARKYVKIAAITSAGQGAMSDVATGVPFDDPSAPTGLVLTPGPGEMLAEWVAPTSTGGLPVMGYRIETSTDGLAWTTLIADTGSSVTRALLSGLTGGSTTFVRVAAITTLAVGATGSPSSATALASAPNSVTAVAGDASVSLTWTDPLVPGITGYRIERSVDGGPYSTLVDVASTSLGHLDTGLTNGSSYTYRVSVLTGSSVGASSSQALAIPLGTPSSPSSLVSVAGDRNVALSWSAPANSAGRTITGYRVESSTDGNTWITQIADTGTPVLSASITGLSNGTTYSFRVTALSRTTSGVASSATSSTPATTATAATSLSVVGGDTTATLSWVAPSFDGGSPITGYRIEQSSNGSTWTSLVTNTGSTSTNAVLNSLVNGQTYVVRVVPLTAIGAGVPSTGVVVTPRGGANAPTSLNIVTGSNSAIITWTAPSADGGSPITGYRIAASTDGGNSFSVLVANTGSAATGHTVTGLVNGAPMIVKVAAITAFGVGTLSAASAVFTPSAPPSAPRSLSVVGGNTTATVTWTAPATTSGAPVSGYEIESSSDGGVTWSTVSTSATSPYLMSGLTNGITYLVRVSAVNVAGVGTPSSMVTVTPAGTPNAPQGLGIVSGNGLLSLSWAAPANSGGLPVVSYTVQTSLDGTNWSTVGSGSPATTAVISGLTNGVLVNVRVAASNAAGIGAYTTSVAATPSIGAVAGIVTNLVATPGNGQVALSWNAPSATGGTPISGYVVSQSFDGSTWTNISSGTGSAVTAYLVTGLTNGTPVSFRVSAVNGAGAGAFGAPATATPRTPASSPTNLVATPDNGQVTLSWSAPSSNGGAPVTSYIVESSTDGGTTWTYETTTSSSLHTVSGLTNGVAYAFRVSAVNAGGTGSATRPALATPFSVSGAVVGLAATPGDGQAVVSWSVPSNTGGAPVSSYGVSVSTDGGTTFGAERTVTGTNSIVTGLSNGIAAVIRVVPIGAGGRGTPSTVSVTSRAVPAAPSNLTATSGNGQVVLSWSTPASDGGSPVDSYAIERMVVSSGIWTRIDTTVSTSYTATGLTNGTEYAFRVLATNASGDGPSSVPANVTPATVPTQPLSVVLQVSDSALTVSWSAPASNGGSVVTSYIVETSVDSTNWVARLSTTATSVTIPGLTNGQSYAVRVKAISGAGTGSASNAVSAAPAAAPAAPTALTPVAGDRQMTLTWSAPSNNGGAPIIDYVVEASANGGVTWRSVGVVNAPTTVTVVSGLSNGVAYVFRVGARNVAGVGAASTWVTAAPVAPPRAPTSVVATSVNATPTSPTATASLAWVPPTDDGGATVAGYRIQTSTDGGLTWGSTVRIGPDVFSTDPFAGLSVAGVDDSFDTTRVVRQDAPMGDSGLATATTLTVDGLTFGLAYQFRVQAYTVIGESDWQATTLTPERPVLPPTTPSAVVDQRYLPVSNGLQIVWSMPQSGAPVTAYLVERQRPDGSWEFVALSATSPVVDTRAVLGVTYTYRITPYSGFLAGESALVANARVPANPNPAIGLRIGATGEPTSTRFTVSAQDLSPRSRTTIVLERPDGSVVASLGGPSVSSGGRLSFAGRVPRDLAPGRYVIRLSALDVYGQPVETTTAFDVTATWNPIDSVTPVGPEMITRPTFGRSVDGGLELRWDRPSSGPAPSSYLIERKRSDGTWEVVGITGTSPFRDSTAVLGETYDYRITPFEGSTPGTATVIEQVRVPADTRLSTDLVFDGRGQPTTVSFAWSGRDLRPGTVAHVRLESADGSVVVELGRETVGPDGIVESVAILPSDLSPGSYRVVIEAVDAYGIEVETQREFEITGVWAPSDVEPDDAGPNDGSPDEDSSSSGGLSDVVRGVLYVAGGLVVAVLLAAAGWWLLVARRRDDDEEDQIESGDRP